MTTSPQQRFPHMAREGLAKVQADRILPLGYHGSLVPRMIAMYTGTALATPLSRTRQALLGQDKANWEHHHRGEMSTRPSKTIETFPNPSRQRDYVITFDCPEFTCVCPMTGQPDFARLKIEYVPDELCVELKSLKLYLWSFREEGHFHEAVTNMILDDLVASLRPRQMRIVGEFNVRGGIYTRVEVNYASPET